MSTVLGSIRDVRIQEERKRTAEAEARVEQECEMADATKVRADRLIERYKAVTASLFRRLEELNVNGT